jgi:hypothetical protein
MANKNLLTYASKVTEVKQVYYAPVALVNGNITNSMYVFLSRVDPWSNENSPDQPTQDQRYLKKV